MAQERNPLQAKSLKDRILDRMPFVLAESVPSNSFIDWAKAHIMTEDAVALHFAGHRALEPIYRDMHPHQVWMKGAQVGGSVCAIGKALWIPKALRRDCIYYLPDQAFARIFLTTRVDPILRRSPVLQSGFHSTKYQGLLESDGHFCYFRGLHNMGGAISIPSHVNIYDEVDVLSAENMEWSEDRLAASEMAWKLFLSVGMIPGAGIDFKFQTSDQHTWIVKCTGCRRDSILEEDFPDNIHEFSDGSVAMVCKGCGKEMDRQAGTWVAKYPEKEIRGYRISQLAIGRINLRNLWRKFKEIRYLASKLAKFRCSALAIADAGAMQPITDSVLALCRADGWMTVEKATTSYAGIDVGDICHLVIIDVLPSGRERVLYIETCPSEKLRERYADLVTRFNIELGVGDAMPYKTEIKKLCGDHEGQFYMRYYTGDMDIVAGEEITAEEISLPTVKVERNASLDETVDELVDGRLILPVKRYGQEVMDEFDSNLKLLIKEPHIDAKGNTIHRFKMKVPNHFAMALNNARIAHRLGRTVSGYVGVEPIFIDQMK